MKKKLTKAYLNEDMKKAVTKIAEEKNISESELIRQSIEEYIKVIGFDDDDSPNWKND